MPASFLASNVTDVPTKEKLTFIIRLVKVLKLNNVSENIKRIQKSVFGIILPDIDFIEILNQLNKKTSGERRKRHCVDLIASMSDTQHRLHNLLLERVGEIRKRETRSNVNML